MTDPANHWKLGLFVVLGVGLGVAALVVLGGLRLRHDTLTFYAYFEEAVTGLEQGAAVKYRGVTVGDVARIGIAPDGRHVEVTLELGLRRARQLDWSRRGSNGDDIRPVVPPGLRAQLASQGVSGVKHVQLDYFEPERRPPPELPFPTPAGTVPSIPSTLASLEESLVRMAETFPEVSQRALTVLEQLHGLLAEMRSQRVPEQLASTLARADKTLGVLETKIAALPVAELSAQAQESAARFSQTLEGLDRVLERLRGERGLLASLQRTTESVGAVAGRSRGVEHELAATLRDLRTLIETLQTFVEALERDPEMLLKGRAEVR